MTKVIITPYPKNEFKNRHIFRLAERGNPINDHSMVSPNADNLSSLNIPEPPDVLP